MVALTQRLVVRRSESIADGVREIALCRPDDGPLTAHPPGSHLIVGCRPRPNAYSLTNCGLNPAEYVLAVLRRRDGDGGSRYLHQLRVGDQVAASTPRSAFPPISNARRHLLVAGGIGVTPMLAHARAAVRLGQDVRMLYVHRPGAAAYVEQLAALLGDRLLCTTDRVEFRAALADALIAQPLGSHLYLCGPQPLTDTVRAAATEAGWPCPRVHVERFGPADRDPGVGFTVRLSVTGIDVPVPAGTSLLDALEAAGVRVPSLCRHGVCGECRIPVRSGRPLHRDDVLSEAERAAGDTVLCCVSRSVSDVLEVEL